MVEEIGTFVFDVGTVEAVGAAVEAGAFGLGTGTVVGVIGAA